MASIILVTCGCGLPFQIYFPKSTLYEWGLMGLDQTMGLEHYQEIDRQEMDSGEVDSTKFVFEKFGFLFVDSREAEKYFCPNCLREIRNFEVLKKMKDLASGGKGNEG